MIYCHVIMPVYIQAGPKNGTKLANFHSNNSIYSQSIFCAVRPTQTLLGWQNILSSSYKLPMQSIHCQKLWKLVDSRRNYCDENLAQFFGPPGRLCTSRYTSVFCLESRRSGEKSCGIKVGSLLLGQKYPVRPRALDQFLPRHSCVTDRFISDVQL